MHLRYIIDAKHCSSKNPLIFGYPNSNILNIFASYPQALATHNLLPPTEGFDHILIDRALFRVAIVDRTECVKPEICVPGSRREQFYIASFNEACDKHFPNAWVKLDEAIQMLQQGRPSGYLYLPPSAQSLSVPL